MPEGGQENHPLQRGHILGPVGGLVLAALVLLASYLIGKESGWQFVRGLGAVLVAACVAVVVLLALASRLGRVLIRSLLADLGEGALAAMSSSTEGLASVVTRLEVVLDRQVNSLSRLADLTDADLAHIERSTATREVVICRQEMGPEFVGAEESPDLFLAAVRSNVDRGVKYHWVTENNAISRQREHVVREVFPDSGDQIRVTRLPPNVWERLPFALETVFYRQRQEGGASHIIGFTDVSFALEERRMWRRLSERFCTDWYDRVERELEQSPAI